MPSDEASLVRWTFNDTAAALSSNKCIHDLVAVQAAVTPAASALEWDNDTMTYAELIECASHLAVWLRRNGAAPDAVVALQLHRSLEQVVGVVGSLASGGAYLPLDAKWPLERRAFMIDDMSASL